MTKEQMSRAMSLLNTASSLRDKFDNWVLINLDSATNREIVNVGSPMSYKQGSYQREEIKLPEAMRRLAFQHWRKGIAEQFNAAVRELNQLGVTHGFSLIQFSQADGMPKP